jgi:hypothetical protein
MKQYKRARGFFLPNRLATMLLLILGGIAAALPAVANMDWTSTAGVIAGIGAVAAALVTWLKGWQANESENLSSFKKEDPEHAAMQKRIDELEYELHGQPVQH